jgi:signal transduction histidine kinase
VDLVEVVEELVDLYQVLAEESGVVIEARLPSGDGLARPNLRVLGDAHLISQAAANLLDNAIKYSPRGGTVTIAVVREPEGICLVIADQGPGIPPEKRAASLDRFVRLDTTKDTQGYGLGLNFVAAVAEWHGARLELADNAPGLRASLAFPSRGRE